MSTKHQNGTITSDELTELTGFTDRRHRQLASAGYFPAPTRGQYQKEKTKDGIIRYLRELASKKNGELAQEQLALTKLKRELTRTKRDQAQEELLEWRGNYVEKAVVATALRNVSLHQRAVLQRKLEQELGPNLAGQTTLEILPKMKNAVDEICQIFKEGMGSWMDAPPS